MISGRFEPLRGIFYYLLYTNEVKQINIKQTISGSKTFYLDVKLDETLEAVHPENLQIS